MKDDTVSRLEALFREHPVMVADPPDSAALDDAVAELGVSVSGDYLEFVRRFGAAIVGSRTILGLGAAEAMGDDESSFVEVTKHFRGDGWAGTEDAAVISVDHGGNPIVLAADGGVYVFEHDLGQSEQLAANFEEFLRVECLGLKS